MVAHCPCRPTERLGEGQMAHERTGPQAGDEKIETGFFGTIDAIRQELWAFVVTPFRPIAG